MNESSVHSDPGGELVFTPRGDDRPRLAAPCGADDATDWVQAIRDFHVTGEGSAMPDDPPAGQPLWPVSAQHLLGQPGSACAFPFLLPSSNGEEGCSASPLREVLLKAIEANREAGNDTTLLEAHLEKLLGAADSALLAGGSRRSAEGAEGKNLSSSVAVGPSGPALSAPISTVLDQGLEGFLQSLADSSQAARRELQAEVDALRPHLPGEGALAAFHPHAPLVFYAWVLAGERRDAALRLRGEVRRLAAQLEGRLESDAQLEHQDAQHLSLSMGEQGDSLLDAAALSSLLPGKRGSKPLDRPRRRRMQKALEELRAHLKDTSGDPPFHILHRGPPPELPGLSGAVFHRLREPLGSAIDFFDRLMERGLRVLRAMRIARLEMEGRYRPEDHDPIFERFQWQSCSEDELRALPPVLVLESAQRLSGRIPTPGASSSSGGRGEQDADQADRGEAASSPERRAGVARVEAKAATSGPAKGTSNPGTALSDLSQVLGSARPIHVLALNDDPLTRVSGGGLDLSTGYLPDLGYLAMAHREAFVLQGTLVRPAHLLDGLQKMSETLDPSLALVWVPSAADTPHSAQNASCPPSNSENRPSNLSEAPVQPPSPATSHHWTWTLGWAAHAGRAAVCFTYSPSAGLTWAERFDLQGNPQPDSLCPAYTVPIEDAQGQEQQLNTTLTFAHAAALNPAYRTHFRVIPRQAWDESGEAASGTGQDVERESRSMGRPTQTEIARYLEEFDQTPPAAIPFLWVLDEDNTLQRAVMTREMAAACRDRKRSWRMLQELAGVNNEYVRRAEEKLRRQMEEQMRSQQDELLEQARKRGAEEAIDRLVAVLTGVGLAPGGDWAAGQEQAGRGPEAPTATVPPFEAGAQRSTGGEISELGLGREVAAQSDSQGEAGASRESASGGEAAIHGGGAAGEAVTPDGGPAAFEPYIDTLLCTTCNDCIQLNPLLFQYNSDKQAEIADPSAGTFAQLVQAAENCPAHCIHPGTPRPDDETGTPEMLARAQALES